MTRDTTEFDKQLGQQVKFFREMRQISQEVLATKIGVSYQQLQKYERGIDRIATGRLVEIAKALRIDVNEFFNEQNVYRFSDGEDEIIDVRKYTDVLLAFEEMQSRPARKEVIRFIKRIAGHL